MPRHERRNDRRDSDRGDSRRRGKHHVERLPKAERTEARPKVGARCPGPNSPGPYSTTRSSSSSSLISFSNAHIVLRSPPPPERPASHAARFPDDVVRRLLRLSGHMSIVHATRVCRQWRRIAQDLLAYTRAIDAVALLRPVPRVQLSYPFVLSALAAFPSLASISLKGWPANAEIRDIASSVMQHYASPVLAEIDLSGLSFSDSDLHALVSHCPGLVTLKLAKCDGVDDAMMRRLLKNRVTAMAQGLSKPFKLIDVSSCQSLSKQGVCALLQSEAVMSLQALSGGRMGVLSARGISAHTVNLAGSTGLLFASLSVKPEGLRNVNLSQCRGLGRVSLSAEPSGRNPLSLRYLNLHGASMLQDVDLGESDRFMIPEMEELSLFGARSLGPDFFRRRLHLSSASVVMPNLKTLNLNGCLGLDKLVLVGYSQLEIVDCSGCRLLDHLVAKELPELRKLSVLGQRAPLRLVDIAVPRGAVVQGVRPNWLRHVAGENLCVSFSI